MPEPSSADRRGPLPQEAYDAADRARYGSEAQEPVKMTYSGLTYFVGGKAPEGLRSPIAVCEACDAVLPLTNDALYEHAARCPSKGWAHGV